MCPSDENTAKRNFQPDTTTSTTLERQWAVIVGISKHQSGVRNLEFARRDAEEFAALLQTPSGGGFAPERICLLVDERATTAGITKALRSFLKKPATSDLVILYLACHGGRDPDRPDNLYLITHDTAPDDVSGTALPMREIDLALRENLLAQHVVILADTCHSGGIGFGAGTRGDGSDAGVINAYLERVRSSKRGVALLTSAEANESSFEGPQWGGGHGVFTHFVLEGLRGPADVSRDGVVTTGELFDYVRREVERATDGRQHPVVGATDFDRYLPLAVTAQKSAQAHFDRGRQLFELGRWVSEAPTVFDAAIQELREARRLYDVCRDEKPEVDYHLGLAYLAAGDAAKAVDNLSRALGKDKNGTEVPDEARYFFGLALGREGRLTDAANELRAFAAAHPGDARADWAGDVLAGVLSRTPTGTKRALLIGVSIYQDQRVPSLPGALRDVEVFSQCLVDYFSFARFDIEELRDGAATRTAVLNALGRLSARTAPDDVIVVYFSGLVVATDSPAFLFVHDSNADAALMEGSTVTARELHDLLEHMPALSKTLIIEGECNLAFLELIQKSGSEEPPRASYTALFATSPGELSAEAGPDRGSAFTAAFVEEVGKIKPPVFPRRLIGRVAESLAKGAVAQTPLVVGRVDRRLFSGWDHVDYLWLAGFVERRCFPGFAREELEARYPIDLRDNPKLSLLFIHYGFGRAFLESGSYLHAAVSLRLALGKTGAPDDAGLLYGIAALRNRQYDTASEQLSRYKDDPVVAAQLPAIEGLKTGARRALLVGIDRYQSLRLPSPAGAGEDVRAMQALLTASYGFEDEHVRVLADGDATREAILGAFRDLVSAAKSGPALFYFSGVGSVLADGRPTIVAFDSRSGPFKGDIGLHELEALVGDDPTNLVTILDAAWSHVQGVGWERFAPPERASKSQRSPPSVVLPRIVASIGRVTVGWVPNEPAVETSMETVGGRLSPSLVRVIHSHAGAPMSYAELVYEAGHGQFPFAQAWITGEGIHEALFGNPVEEGRVERALDPATRVPVGEVVRALQERTSTDGAGSVGVQLGLGIALTALGRSDDAVTVLTELLQTRDAKNDARVHYQLGRSLYEKARGADGGDFTGAVAALRLACELGPDDVRVQYYYGQALRALAQRDNLNEAARALRRYLEGGAPLGREDEVLRFLRERGV